MLLLDTCKSGDALKQIQHENLDKRQLYGFSNQLGVHMQRRRGEGTEFFQLREYREGDSIRQIDWKADKTRVLAPGFKFDAKNPCSEGVMDAVNARFGDGSRRPAAFISRSTRLPPIWTPPSARSAWRRGAP